MRKLLSWLIVPGVFLLSILLFVPGRSRYQYDGDEGLFLIAGMLMDQGHAMYDSIWSDQPPVLPAILAAGFRLVGYRVGFARLLIAGFSSLLLGCAYPFLRGESGRPAGAAGVLLIIFSPFYLRLSVTVMNGLPAISLGMLAVLLLVLWHRRRGTHWLVFSGIALALSVGIKLLTGILAPVMGLGLLITGIWGRDRDASWLVKIQPALAWSLSFAAGLAFILVWLVGTENLPDLVTPHLSVNAERVFSEAKYTFAYHIRDAVPLLAAAALGIILALWKRRWLLLYPAGWMLASMVFLASITPSWDHHILLVTVPAALLAGYAVVEAAGWISGLVMKRGAKGEGVVQIVCAALLLLLIHVPNRPDALDHLSLSRDPGETGLQLETAKFEVLQGMIEHAPETEWVLTDSPMMAFRARLPVPPYTAMFSAKRLNGGALTEEDLVRILEEYRPEQVYLGRFELPLLRAALEDGYVIQEMEEGEFAWYIREDIRKPVGKMIRKRALESDMEHSKYRLT